MYTTNITGLRHCARGLSLIKAAVMAGLSNAGSSNWLDFLIVRDILFLSV